MEPWQEKEAKQTQVKDTEKPKIVFHQRSDSTQTNER